MNAALILSYSVPMPFKGDYQDLLANPKWKKLQSQMPQDSHVVFADVVQKIHRANGKVKLKPKQKNR